ncbi:hypothetical protein [Nocardia sp. NPDC057227]|uniref:hypothetical protein n=1 Tax=Nocardia sp. NPDC057227 TaxID=3346056 RepID=UPI0036266130
MSTIEFELIFEVPEVSGPGDPRIEQVEEHLDIVVQSHSGLTLATVTADGAEVLAAALNAAHILAVCGLRPVRSHPDLVTRQDIAERAEVTRQAVGNWVRGERLRTDPFPVPANLVGGGVWLWGDVVAWLRRQGHETDDLEFPSLSDHTRIDSALIELSGDLTQPSAAVRGARPSNGCEITGFVKLAGERTATLYAPSGTDAHHSLAGESFQAEYGLAV